MELKLLNELLFKTRTFKKGDKFEIENNGLKFTVEVLSIDKEGTEIKIETVNSDGKARISYTDPMEMNDRLRDSKSYKKL